jgi:hypothetical protein
MGVVAVNGIAGIEMDGNGMTGYDNNVHAIHSLEDTYGR